MRGTRGRCAKEVIAQLNRLIGRGFLVRKLFALLVFLLAGLSAGALLADSDLAEQRLLGGLPLGNALMAFALCGFSGSAFLVSPRDSAHRRFSALALAASILWLPASALLAGNLALNFSGARGTAWLVGSVAVMVATLVALAWAMVGCAVHRLRLP